MKAITGIMLATMQLIILIGVASGDNKVYSFGYPVADAGGPYLAYEGLSITFDASNSTDNGTIVLYEWDWNNDGIYDESTASPLISHTWGDDFSGTVGLRVTDDDGLTDTATASVTVQNVAPTVEAGADKLGNEGAVVLLGPGTFSDPGWADIHTGIIEWGDGTPAEAATIQEFNGAGTVTGSHVYADNGMYLGVVTVGDDDDGFGADTFLVAVVNVAPTVDAGPNQIVNEGSLVYFNGSFTDPGVYDTHIIFWDFGDGTNTTGTLTATHVYENNGPYIVTLKVTDDDGGVGSDTLDIIVNAKIEIPIKGGENATIEGNMTITNALVTRNTLHFDASGPSGSTGWINVTFPMVNTTNIKVFINEEKLTPPPFPIITSNGTHYFIYFEFTLSTHSIEIQFGPTAVGGISIPANKLELLAPYIGLTILLAVAVLAVGYVKKRKRNTEIVS